jgi:hypothetical protein
MPRPKSRLLVLAAGALSLLFAGQAAAAYTTPRLTILNPSERVGGGGPLTLVLSQSRADEATHRVVVYAPLGYVSSLVPQVGQTLGRVDASFETPAQPSGAAVTASGAITAGDPAAYGQSAAARACVGDGTPIDAVYLLNLAGAGRTQQVPVYVTTITGGSEAGFASGKLTACFASPYVPESAGGAPAGAKLLSARLRLDGIFTNPSTRGRYTWRALWTPYRAGTATSDTAGRVETQAIDGIGAQLTATARYNRRTKRIVVSGMLLQAPREALPNALVRVRVRGRFQRVARTNARGLYAQSLRWQRKGSFLVTVTASQAAATADGCSRGPTFAVPCLATRTSAFTVTRSTRVRVR